MKQFTIAFAFSVFAVLASLPSQAHEGQEHDAAGKHSVRTVEQPVDCKHCGMDRTKFAHSRALVEYENGEKAGVCSINCAVIDLDKNPKLKLKKLLVADYTTKKLIDAATAHWVIGGSRRGVMTRYAKWAFADKKDADAFIREFGGKPGGYEDIVTAVRNEINSRTH